MDKSNTTHIEISTVDGQHFKRADSTYIEPIEVHDKTEDSEYETALDRNLTRKIDRKLIPWLCLLPLVSFLDRTNIGNAKIAGLQKDLHMTNGQWNAALCIFFVSYSVFEPVSNALLKRLRPSIYLPALIILWGIMTVCQGLVHNFAGLAAARWFLGAFEAGLLPGINFYLSCWYERTELGVRFAVFFSAAAIAGSFGGLLAAAIGEMKGVGGYPGWAWILIIEGLATVVIGVASFWMAKASCQTGTRSPQDNSEGNEFKWLYVRQSLTDWETYTAGLIYMGCGGGLYAFSLFLPMILAELGYKTIRAQLLSVPPYAAAALLTIAIGYIGDRTKQRGICAMLVSPLGIICFIMLLTSNSAGVKYAATFLAAMDIYPCIPNTITWVANNTFGQYKRGVTLGVAMGWANLQGIIISNVYRGADAPRFIPGHAVVTGYLGLLFGGSVLHYVLLRRENRIRRATMSEDWALGKSAAELELLGDKRPDFIYTL